MTGYYAPGARRWDALARVPYHSFDSSTGTFLRRTRCSKRSGRAAAV